MKYFWTHKDNIPEGMGYGQFSFKHLMWLILTIIFVVGVVFLYGQLEVSSRITLLRSIGATLIIIDIIKMILIYRSDVVFLEYLPLELCSFAAYFIVCDSILVGNDIFPELLLTMFLPAAIMAILFPTTSTLPAINFYTIHQFLYHGLIIAYVMARYINLEIPLTYPGVWKGILQIILLATVIYIIDTVFNKNFMFLRDTYDNPLLNVIWKLTGGGIKYTGGLVCFCIIMIHVFFAIFKLIELLILH
ncbi:MAG: YwaF family protein [Erysipelotrichaceae bacterium]|nr:YwaF family protein [Erysipelotrichaceae bacterium]